MSKSRRITCVIAAGLGYRAPALAGAVLALAAIVVWAPAAWLRARALRSGADDHAR